MKSILPILLLTALLCTETYAANRVKGVIGDTDMNYRTTVLQKGESRDFSVNLKDASLLRIREVYPDTPRQPRYTYDAFIDGRLVFKRD